MQYHQLETASKKSGKRVGRGIAAGQGKTAGRGTKGQGSRTGSSKRPGFEGGQNPLMQRLPKLRGFKSKRVPAVNVYTDQLASVGKVVNSETLAAKGLIASPYVRVKLLARGELSAAVTVELQAASVNAVEAIQKAGGTFKAVSRTPRPVTKKEDK